MKAAIWPRISLGSSSNIAGFMSTAGEQRVCINFGAACTKDSPKIDSSFWWAKICKRETMHLPPELLACVAEYIVCDLQAVNPRCYRAARRLQSVCRGWLVRTHGDPATTACARIVWRRAGSLGISGHAHCEYCYYRRTPYVHWLWS